jgi:membrane protease YdiL (CAAX protease family)
MNLDNTQFSNFEYKRFPRALPTIAWLIIYLVLQIVTSLFCATISIMRSPHLSALLKTDGQAAIEAFTQSPEYIPATLIALMISAISMIAILYYDIKRNHAQDIVRGLAPSVLGFWKTLGLGLLLWLFAQNINGIYVTLMPSAHAETSQKETLNLITRGESSYLLAFITLGTAVFLAPIVEELLFRGYLQNLLLRYLRFLSIYDCGDEKWINTQNKLLQFLRIPVKCNFNNSLWVGFQNRLLRCLKPFYAFPLTAFIFAAYHLQPLAIVPLFVMGLAFGIFYHITKSLTMSIMLHAFNNAVGVVLVALQH